MYAPGCQQLLTGSFQLLFLNQVAQVLAKVLLYRVCIVKFVKPSRHHVDILTAPILPIQRHLSLSCLDSVEYPSVSKCGEKEVQSLLGSDEWTEY